MHFLFTKFLELQEQTIVNNKWLHSGAVAQQSSMATNDAAVIKATALIEKVAFAENAKIPIKKNILPSKKNIPVQGPVFS